MDYENRENRFYDGSEQNMSLSSNIGSVKGLEYLFQFSKGRQQGRDFKSEMTTIGGTQHMIMDFKILDITLIMTLMEKQMKQTGIG